MKYFLLIITACILAAFTTVSYAQSQDYLMLHGVSKHVTSEQKDYQEQNPGLSYRLQKNQFTGYQFGAYLNSHNRVTTFEMGFKF